MPTMSAVKQVTMPTMPTMSAVKQVTMPTMPTMSSVKQVTMPTMPTMSAVKQVTMPTIPTMSAVKQVTVPTVKQVTILKQNNVEDVLENEKTQKKNLEWSYIEWSEKEEEDEEEDDTTVLGTTDSETQTAPPPVVTAVVDKETQTSSPVIMHIELARSQSSRLKHPGALAAVDQLVAPLFQFNRQAPARISTSPTLRRMRSTRRIVRDFRDSVRLGCTREEEPGDSDSASPRSPVSSLAADGANGEPRRHGEGTGASSSSLQSRHRSMTFDNGVSCGRPASRALQSSGGGNEFDFPSRKDQEKEETCHDRLQGRRRSSVVVSLPGLDVSPGDLFVSNGAADILNRSTFSDNKKSKWPFSRRSTTKCKASTHTASDIEKILSAERVQDWDDSTFHKFKDCSLGEFLRDQSVSLCPDRDPQDYRKQEAIWEIFTSECVYFLDQLMVLKEVFLATLTSLQTRDCLSDVDAWRLFANLNELCLVSHDFLSSLLKVIRDSWTPPESQEGPTLLELLTKAFQESICHCLQKYCLNYSSSLLYLENLNTRQDVASYVKWCEKHQQCRRLRLRDLLVAPLQRLTRYPLLLRNVRKRSEEEEEQSALSKVVEQVETSICDLEGKVKWLDNYQKVKQLRDSLVWLPVWERDKRTFIPETLKHLMKAVTLENLITHRSLLYDGRLQLTENTKLHDVYLFLFDEFLLITKMKRNKKKSAVTEQSALQLVQNQELDQLLKDGCTFTVQDQPLSLDRLHLRNVDQLNASASGLPHSFIILHQNRYQQVIGAFVLQAPSEAIKRVWMSKLEGAVTALLKLDSQQPRAKSESSQI